MMPAYREPWHNQGRESWHIDQHWQVWYTTDDRSMLIGPYLTFDRANREWLRTHAYYEARTLKELGEMLAW